MSCFLFRFGETTVKILGSESFTGWLVRGSRTRSPTPWMQPQMPLIQLQILWASFSPASLPLHQSLHLCTSQSLHPYHHYTLAPAFKPLHQFHTLCTFLPVVHLYHHLHPSHPSHPFSPFTHFESLIPNYKLFFIFQYTTITLWVKRVV